MADTGHVLNGLASLAWPGLIGSIFYFLKEPISNLLESLKGRNFDVVVGNTKLSIGQATDQLSKELGDLRTEFNKLKSHLEPDQLNKESVFKAEESDSANTISRILWVDDKPQNNAFIVKELQDKGLTIDLSISTKDGIGRLNRQSYDMVISDMGRYENNRSNYRAGLDLLGEFKKLNFKIPFVLFCPPISINKFGTEALGMGADLITSSSTDLIAFIEHRQK